ncbi:hypothetical protein Pmani_009981 [Petrolisthes manimaculis]|uniref:Uncharacterized protein n=1 Tax=Petrolisthes manimaculis TaxID=1843537 RepID=A0AAE1UHT7_9EUCA|nr:hypothetical protein Pmani_009981 [Petrolisthes manimaculis]
MLTVCIVYEVCRDGDCVYNIVGAGLASEKVSGTAPVYNLVHVTSQPVGRPESREMHWLLEMWLNWLPHTRSLPPPLSHPPTQLCIPSLDLPILTSSLIN